MIITFFKLNKIWIRLTKYSLWVKLKCSHYKTFFEMLRYLPLLAWKWPMKCSMKCKVSWYFISLWESLCSRLETKELPSQQNTQKLRKLSEICRINELVKSVKRKQQKTVNKVDFQELMNIFWFASIQTFSTYFFGAR